MPGLIVFRRRWSVGSDDLVVPGAFLFTVHLIWWVWITMCFFFTLQFFFVIVDVVDFVIKSSDFVWFIGSKLSIKRKHISFCLQNVCIINIHRIAQTCDDVKPMHTSRSKFVMHLSPTNKRQTKKNGDRYKWGKEEGGE